MYVKSSGITFFCSVQCKLEQQNKGWLEYKGGNAKHEQNMNLVTRRGSSVSESGIVILQDTVGDNSVRVNNSAHGEIT